MTGRRWIVFVVALAVAGTAVPAAVGTTAAQSGGGQLSADSVLIHVSLFANESAIWEIEYHYRLTNANRTRGFERLRSDIERNREEYVADIRRDLRVTVRIAQNRTGREMDLTGVGVRTRRQRIPEEVGVVTHRFEWEGFAVANGSRLRAGDAISGFYVGPNTRLRIAWPSEYRPVTVDPQPIETTDSEAIWQDRQFASDEPRIVLEREPETTTEAAAGPTRTATEANAAGANGENGGVPVTLLGAAVVVVLVGAGAGSVALFRGGTEVETEDSDELPEELLSNEERVKAVLEDHGGRVKQQTIAEECDWGPSKTSKVIADMEDEGVVDVFRIGRENVVALPEESDLP